MDPKVPSQVGKEKDTYPFNDTDLERSMDIYLTNLLAQFHPVAHVGDH